MITRTNPIAFASAGASLGVESVSGKTNYGAWGSRIAFAVLCVECEAGKTEEKTGGFCGDVTGNAGASSGVECGSGRTESLAGGDRNAPAILIVKFVAGLASDVARFGGDVKRNAGAGLGV